MGCAGSRSRSVPNGVESRASAVARSASGEGKHRIYAKTEPGGSVCFGRLEGEELQQLLLDSLRRREMAHEIIELPSDPPTHFRQVEGVTNGLCGRVGERGNEGIIRIDAAGPITVPLDANGEMENGFYLVQLALSKVSIEFEFMPPDGTYDPSRLTEVCVPVELPGCVEHERYGEPEFNIVVGYEYDGTPLQDYDGELCDRGYDTQITIFQVRQDDCELLYTRYVTESHSEDHGWDVRETWPSTEVTVRSTVPV